MTTRIGLRLLLEIAIGASIGCDRATKHMAGHHALWKGESVLPRGYGRFLLSDLMGGG